MASSASLTLLPLFGMEPKANRAWEFLGERVILMQEISPLPRLDHRQSIGCTNTISNISVLEDTRNKVQKRGRTPVSLVGSLAELVLL